MRWLDGCKRRGCGLRRSTTVVTWRPTPTCGHGDSLWSCRTRCVAHTTTPAFRTGSASANVGWRVLHPASVNTTATC